ncbi:MAG: hypothetical protein M1817_001706 [Caeruleum heppii]|nr:MAG: hypothetical protein M1817_001706 [Caeruleum heppii]
MATAMGDSLTELAAIVSDRSQTLVGHLKARGLQQPTFGPQQLASLPLEQSDTDIQKVRRELIEASRCVTALAQGPREILSFYAFAYHDLSSLGTILKFRIAELVPLDGSISFAELAKKAGLLEDKLVRILRYAFTNYIFTESPEGHVSHSAISATLARDPKFATFLQLVVVDLFPPASRLVESLVQHPFSERPTETAMNIAFDTKDVFFSWLKEDIARQERFNIGMAGFSDGGDRPQNVDVAAYPWQDLPKGSTVVDVAGGSGHVSLAIAKAHAGLRLVVEDSKAVVETSEADFTRSDQSGLQSEVSFRAHDFFREQPVKGADVYFFRQIMHDWPTHEAVMILRQLLPALKVGARVLISEYVVPPPGVLTGLEDKMIRQMDMQMMAIFNAKERTAKEYKDLFAAASPRLHFTRTFQVSASDSSCIFEAVYEAGWEKPVLLRDRLHKQYGPVVRINPEELHVRDKEMYLQIFKVGSKWRKSDRFYGAFASDNSVFNVSDPSVHREKRLALSPLFTQRAVLDLEPLIQRRIDRLCGRLVEYHHAGNAVNFHFAFRALAVDVVTDFCYAQSYNQLDIPDFKGRHVVALEANASLLYLFKNLTFLASWLAAAPLWIMKLYSADGAGNAEMLREARNQVKRLIEDRSLLKADHATVFQRLLSLFPKPDEDTVTYLTQEANTLVTAGSETTAEVLTVGLFRILQSPTMHQKLLAELKQAIPDVNKPTAYTELAKLPYLTGCVKESLRATYGVLGALPRVVPKGGVMIHGHFVPEGTTVGMDHYSLHHDETVFPDSHKFKPERWIEGDAKEMDKYLASFSHGTRQCVGIQLAYAELYMILANVIRRFDLRPYDGFSEDDFVFRDVWLHSLPKQNLAAFVTPKKV